MPVLFLKISQNEFFTVNYTMALFRTKTQAFTMKGYISFVSLFSMFPIVVHASLRGESSNTASRGLMKSECRDIPIRVRTDDSQVNFATLYTGLYAWGDVGNLDDKKLCDKFIETYSSLTDCRVIPGSFRVIGDCTVVEDALGPNGVDPNAQSVLLKLTYFANVVNGAMLYHHDDPDPSCYCDRCPGLDPFPGIYSANDSGPICTCYCDIFSDDLTNTACTCRSPVISTLIDELNKKYENDEFYFLDARQLAIDEGCVNPTDVTTFDDTFLCPGQQDEAMKELFTDFPSASPSASASAPTA
jgi:hypothetical protein